MGNFLLLRQTSCHHRVLLVELQDIIIISEHLLVRFISFVWSKSALRRLIKQLIHRLTTWTSREIFHLLSD
jgi:hypothetical protein